MALCAATLLDSSGAACGGGWWGGVGSGMQSYSAHFSVSARQLNSGQ